MATSLKKMCDRYEGWTKKQLVDELVNNALNDFIAEHDKWGDDERDPYGHGKRIPYIGWFWRSVDFANEYYTIGDCGEFIGFMENNKWGYASRRLTPDESKRVTKIVLAAYTASREGGILSDIIKNTYKKIDKLWPLLQTFPMEVEGWWIHGSLQGQCGFTQTEEDADEMVRLLSEAAPAVEYWKVKA